MSPQTWGLIGLAISTVFAFVVAFVERKKGSRSARIVQAFGGALKKGLADKASHKPTLEAFEDAVYDFADELALDPDHIDEHVSAAGAIRNGAIRNNPTDPPATQAPTPPSGPTSS